MALETAADRAALMSTDDAAETITYAGDSGVVALVNRPREPRDIGFGEVELDSTQYEIRLPVESLSAPAEGDAVIIDGASLEVEAVGTDESGNWWVIWCS